MTLIAKAKPLPVKQEHGLAAAWKAKAKALAVEVRNWERSYDRLEETLARLLAEQRGEDDPGNRKAVGRTEG